METKTEQQTATQIKFVASYRTAPNIALIKYWGKYDQEYILPLNNSISVTLSNKDLFTETKISMKDCYKEDVFILNNKVDKFSSRIIKILQFFRENCTDLNLFDKDNTISKMIPKSQVQQMKLKIKSYNNFPTASGLASSASGLACLVICLADLYQFKEQFEGQLTMLARIGSGSACRSIQGGFVEWEGVPLDILQSQQKLNENQLQNLSQRCIAKQYRVQNFVFEQVKHLKEALANKDFNKLMEVTMRDSNQFHAICQDTYPPIFYLNEFSKQIINIISKLNEVLTDYKIGYTFDAGPHAVVFIHNNIFKDIFKTFIQILNLNKEKFNENGQQYFDEISSQMNEIENEKIKQIILNISPLITQYPSHVIKTQIGTSPTKLSNKKN